MDAPASPRARSLAALLPALGLFLLMPPFVLLFTGPARPGGVPLVVAYLFGVWAALLVVAFLLSRALHPPAGGREPPEPPAGGAPD